MCVCVVYVKEMGACVRFFFLLGRGDLGLGDIFSVWDHRGGGIGNGEGAKDLVGID